MAAKVACVEKPLPGRLDEQHVGVEGGVVGENRRNGERPNREWPGTAVPRLECPGERQARLVFWEAKAFGNGELRTAGEDVPVCYQIEVYRKYLSDPGNRTAIEKEYTLVAKNLVDIKNMGWVRRLSTLIEDIGLGRRILTLEPKVGLIIFGFGAPQRDDPAWTTHLERLKEKIGDVRAAADAKNIQLCA